MRSACDHGTAWPVTSDGNDNPDEGLVDHHQHFDCGSCTIFNNTCEEKNVQLGRHSSDLAALLLCCPSCSDDLHTAQLYADNS